MSNIWGIPSPSKSWTEKPPIFEVFRQLRNLTTTLATHIFGMKRDIDNRGMALETTKDPYSVLKCHELWSTNGLI